MDPNWMTDPYITALIVSILIPVSFLLIRRNWLAQKNADAALKELLLNSTQFKFEPAIPEQNVVYPRLVTRDEFLEIQAQFKSLLMQLDRKHVKEILRYANLSSLQGRVRFLNRMAQSVGSPERFMVYTGI